MVLLGILVVIKSLCSGCRTAIVHMLVEQNSWGHGFESHRVLAFFLIFSILSVVCP